MLLKGSISIFLAKKPFSGVRIGRNGKLNAINIWAASLNIGEAHKLLRE